MSLRVAVLIPAHDEAGNIGPVVSGFRELRRAGAPVVDEVVVVDHRSNDDTGQVAADAGAVVVREEGGGYGQACQRGLSHLAGRADGAPDVVVFCDGNGSAEPAELLRLIESIESGAADFVVGSRRRLSDPGTISPQQRFGNGLACTLMRLMYGARYTDLAPFRAIRWSSLMELGMRDRDYGWSIEMQVKACKQGLRTEEIDVRTHPRQSGRSKVSGTLRGAVGAGVKILFTIWRYR